jgi:putative endonuclease
MKSSGNEDWKKRLKSLGIARKRGPKRTGKEDFPRKEEGGRPAEASGQPQREALASPPSFEETPGRAPRTRRKLESGLEGEDIASLFLEEHSLRILARNVRYRDGEIDIVALDGETTVFVEVKRRRDSLLGTPAEAVTQTKRRRVVRAARRWLAAHPGRSRAVRFDVVAVLGDPPAVTWIKSAFDLQGPA